MRRAEKGGLTLAWDVGAAHGILGLDSLEERGKEFLDIFGSCKVYLAHGSFFLSFFVYSLFSVQVEGYLDFGDPGI